MKIRKNAPVRRSITGDNFALRIYLEILTSEDLKLNIVMSNNFQTSLKHNKFHLQLFLQVDFWGKKHPVGMVINHVKKPALTGSDYKICVQK